MNEEGDSSLIVLGKKNKVTKRQLRVQLCVQLINYRKLMCKHPLQKIPKNTEMCIVCVIMHRWKERKKSFPAHGCISGFTKLPASN